MGDFGGFGWLFTRRMVSQAKRKACFSCSTPKPVNPNRGRPNNHGPNTRRDGDWDCPACNNLNFAYRTECRQCGESIKASDL